MRALDILLEGCGRCGKEMHGVNSRGAGALKHRNLRGLPMLTRESSLLYYGVQVWPLTQDLNGLFLAGSFLLPYSWALHVACWIQRNNNK